MPVSGNTIELLMKAGIAGEQLLEIIRSVEADYFKPRSGAAERQARYRNKYHNVVTSQPITNEPSRVEDNTLPSFTSGKEVKEESKTSLTVSSASKPLPSSDPDGFQTFWVFYPKRDGSADRKGAVKAFKAALRRTDIRTILDGVEAFGLAMAERDKIGTEFIPQARTWLNGDRWNERYSAPPAKPNGIQDGFAKVRSVIDEIERRETAASGGPSTEDAFGLPGLRQGTA